MSLDPFFKTEFVIKRLKAAETRDWMASRPKLRKAIITNDLSMPGLVDVVVNIVGVWPFVVSYLKETGRKDDGGSFVVKSSTVGVLLHHINVLIFLCRLEERDGRVYVPRSACLHEIQVVSFLSRNL